MGLQSSLGRAIQSGSDIDEMKRQGWEKHQMLVVSLADERLNWMERETIMQIGKKLYGEAPWGVKR